MNDWSDLWGINNWKILKACCTKVNKRKEIMSKDELYVKVMDGCDICKKRFNFILDFHHVDNNHFNGELSNLIYICPNCHAKLHRADISDVIKHFSAV